MIVQPFSFLQGSSVSGGCAPIQNTNFDPVPDVGDGYSSSNEPPVNAYYNYSLNAFIIPQSQMGTAKQITSMSFKQYGRSNAGTYTMLNQYVKFGHTTETSLPSGTFYPRQSNSTPAADLSMSYISGFNISDEILVMSGSWTVNGGNANSYSELTFNENNFCYNGTDNIIVLWISNWGGFASNREWFLVDDGSSFVTDLGAYSKSDTTTPSNLGLQRQSELPVIRMDY